MKYQLAYPRHGTVYTYYTYAGGGLEMSPLHTIIAIQYYNARVNLGALTTNYWYIDTVA